MERVLAGSRPVRFCQVGDPPRRVVHAVLVQDQHASRSVPFASEADLRRRVFEEKLVVALGKDQTEGDGAPGGIAACSQQANLKPVASPFGPIFMKILNRSGQDIKVFRLSNTGQRDSVSMPPMPPVGNDRSVRILAQRSSLVIVTDASDNCLEAILPGETTRTVTVRPPGVAPGETTMPRRSPLPDGEAVLRRYIEDARRGEPKYEQMVADAQDVTRRQLGRIRAILNALGAMQSTTFAGVSPADDDIYHVRFDNGTTEWRIDMAEDGKIRRIALGPE
jgi:hypothetical protein